MQNAGAKSKNKIPMMSIIIPAYNRETRLVQTLTTVLGQKSHKYDLEIVIVDDASTDGTWEVIESLGNSVIGVKHASNLGPNAARTTGFRRSTGDYITFLDSDDLLNPGSIATHIAALESSGADVCYSNWDIITEDDVGHQSYYSTRISGDIGDPINALLADWWSPPFVYTIRRSCLTDPFPWDCLVQSRGCEDFDLVFQIAFTGAKFVYDKSIRGSYVKHDDGRVSDANLSRTFLCGKEILEKTQAQLTRHGILTEERKLIFARRYLALAKNFYSIDKKLFADCIRNMKTTCPDYTGDSHHYKALVNMLGFNNTEFIYETRRNILKFLHRLGLLKDVYGKSSSVRLR